METQRKDVFTITEGKNGKKYWHKIGMAHENKDGSLNVYFFAMPIGNSVQIRDKREKTEYHKGSKNKEESDSYEQDDSKIDLTPPAFLDDIFN